MIRQTPFWAIALMVGMNTLAYAETYTLYSDKGTPSSSVFVQPASVLPYPSDTSLAPPEGYTSWKTVQPTTDPAYWGYTFTDPQDFSRFNGGELRFWAYSPSGAVRVEIKNDSGVAVLSRTFSSLGWTSASSNKWVLLRASLAGIDLTSVSIGFDFAIDNGPITYSIDNVRYVSSSAFPLFTVTTMKRSDNSPATDLTWTEPTLPAGWVMADQYLSLDIDTDAKTWGVQIYTDNTSATANPQFVTPVPVGTHGSNPAGLVFSDVKNSTLPMAWAITASTMVATVPVFPQVPLVAGDPNSLFPWSYMEDRFTPAIPSDNIVVPFANGQIGNVVRNSQGIHYGHNNFALGAEVPPNPIYIEADFSSAYGHNTYQTSTLTIEFFTP